MITTKSKLGVCSVCNNEAAKYKCPACSKCSCSLICVTKHKNQDNCSGVRNRVAVIPRHEMDNFTLLNDYRFLEEIDHKLEDCTRMPLRKSVVKGREMLKELPFHLQKLINEARKRKTSLTLVPKHFKVRKENTTRYSFADKKIRWHVKLIFPHADLEFIEEKVDEDLTLFNILRKYMEPHNRFQPLQPNISSLNLTDEQLERLGYYQSASYGRIVVLLQSLLCQRDANFIVMRPSKSLKTNLANRKIVEFPTFLVILREHLDTYIENDDHEETIEEWIAFNTQGKNDCLKEHPLTEVEGGMTKMTLQAPKVNNEGLSFFNADSIDSTEEDD